MADSLSKLLGGAGMADDVEGEGEGGGDSKIDAAKDLIAALKGGDAAAVSLALERHYEACKASEDEYEDDDEEV